MKYNIDKPFCDCDSSYEVYPTGEYKGEVRKLNLPNLYLNPEGIQDVKDWASLVDEETVEAILRI